METSQGEGLCNQWTWLITIDQTQAPWQPLPHFPKQRPARHSVCAAVTWCYAWLTLGRLAGAQCLFLVKGAQWLNTVVFRAIVSIEAML